MNPLQAILLGIVQGLTEFIPVSSTGHLLLLRHILGMHQEVQGAFVFDLLIQMGTWVAVVVFYWKDLVSITGDMLNGLRHQPAPQARLGWLLVIATIPAVIIGWLAKDSMNGIASGLGATGLFLLANAAFLLIAEFFDTRQREAKDLTGLDALWIGGFQALALLPAISRSAATISGAMTRNLRRRQAARFAFLMAVPIMPAAAVVGLLDLGNLPNPGGLLVPLLLGFAASAIVGYFSIRWLLAYLSRKSLYLFAVYCTAAGLLAILFQFLQ
jgi:undecaprenyl-diphosphatase